jgi:hypothetical protein
VLAGRDLNNSGVVPLQHTLGFAIQLPVAVQVGGRQQ